MFIPSKKMILRTKIHNLHLRARRGGWSTGGRMGNGHPRRERQGRPAGAPIPTRRIGDPRRISRHHSSDNKTPHGLCGGRAPPPHPGGQARRALTWPCRCRRFPARSGPGVRAAGEAGAGGQQAAAKPPGQSLRPQPKPVAADAAAGREKMVRCVKCRLGSPSDRLLVTIPSPGSRSQAVSE